MTFGSVKSVMDSLVTDPDMKGKTAKEIKMILNRRLLVNNVKGLNQGKQKAFKFTKLSNGYKLTCHYEQRGPIISNLEFVATFDHEVEIPSR